VTKARAPATIALKTQARATMGVVMRTSHHTAMEASTTTRLVKEENSTPTEAMTNGLVSRKSINLKSAI
jgi:hypothetical protein